MPTLGDVARATRTNMIDLDMEAVSQEFGRRFGLREGDYINVSRQTSQGKTR